MAQSSDKFTTFFESLSIVSTTTGVDADVVYTVPLNHDAEITLLTCTNGAAVNRINVLLFHADSSIFHYIVREHSVPGNDTFSVITSDRLFLQAGDKVVAYKAGGTFDVAVSGKQFYNPVRIN
jgi:sortase (surface protein transpeptidase)